MRIAVANQKGGVGKTSVTCGLASAAAHAGRRVLLVDLDPQANATAALGAIVNDDGTVAAMTGRRPIIQETGWGSVDALASSLTLARTDMDGSHAVPFRLDEALSRLDLTGYDVILVDLPPSVGRLLAAGLVAADALLLVTDATADGVKGIANVTDTYRLVRDRMNTQLRLLGIVVNRYRRTSEQQYREDELRRAYGDQVLPGHLPERAALPEAHAATIPIHRHTTAGARELASLMNDLWVTVETRTRQLQEASR